MARTEARIKTSIWTDDDDWLPLSSRAKLAYLTLLSQPNVSLCGVLAFTPGAWSIIMRLSRRQVEEALDELTAHNFIVIDKKTDEVLIRSFVKNDGVLGKPNIIVACSKDYGAIHSKVIRQRVIEQFPKGFLEGLAEQFPKAFEQGFVERLAQVFVEAFGEPSRVRSSILHPPSSTSLQESDVETPTEPLAHPFEDFWDAYPTRHGKKIGKAKAETAWKKLTDAQRTSAMTAVSNYRHACDADLTLAKDAERWLRGTCYYDWLEPATVAKDVVSVTTPAQPKPEPCPDCVDGWAEPNEDGFVERCPSCEGSGRKVAA